MLEVVNWIIENPVQVITGIVTVAAAIAAITPSPEDDKAVAKARKVLDALALNVGHAKNAKRGEVDRTDRRS
jgi:hypothetical protein